MATAENFVEKAPDDRLAKYNNSVPVHVIKNPYQEPLLFTQHFFAWSISQFPEAMVCTAMHIT